MYHVCPVFEYSLVADAALVRAKAATQSVDCVSQLSREIEEAGHLLGPRSIVLKLLNLRESSCD